MVSPKLDSEKCSSGDKKVLDILRRNILVQYIQSISVLSIISIWYYCNDPLSSIKVFILQIHHMLLVLKCTSMMIGGMKRDGKEVLLVNAEGRSSVPSV